MKKIIREANLTAEQLNTAANLAANCGLCEETARILVGRGVDTEDKAQSFLHPGKQHFLPPQLMSGINEAVELIMRAREEEWSVAIYGDYDADGICAVTILKRCLAEFGIDAYPYVPERKNGYGLSTEAIDEIFEECFPQLFITVDCGISNAAEVEYIKEQGAEVIVTDHHELPKILPDCLCINPKISDDYPYDNLCGAGVAFKLGCALIGREAYKYLDFAAIATVADSVPLTGENRDIVFEGLRLINRDPRKNYSSFINKKDEKIQAQTLAFSVAPKINAAGRIGDARSALALFLTDDEGEIYDLSVKLTAYNAERQRLADELYLSAKEKLKKKGKLGRIIILWDESWNSGFVGVVAPRIAEEFRRPTILFVKNGDTLKGSARSVDGVNIFEALTACSQYISQFGGHSQAAGVHVEESNLAALESALDEYLTRSYPEEAFRPTVCVSGVLKPPVSLKLVKELELLEPCGVGNKKPLFEVTAAACQARPIKAGSAHLSVKSDGLDMICFSGVKYSSLVKAGIPKRMVFEYALSTYRGKEQVSIYLRDIVYEAESCAFATDEYAFNTVDSLSADEVACERVEITKRDAQNMLKNRGEFGTVFIASCAHTVRQYDVCGTEVNAFVLSATSTASAIVISPDSFCDLSAFDSVVYLDDPAVITLPSLSGKRVYVCKEISGIASLSGLNCDREYLGDAFRYISANCFSLTGESYREVAASHRGPYTPTEMLFALLVFDELGLITLKNGRVAVERGIKTQLNNSRLYNAVCGAIKS